MADDDKQARVVEARLQLRARFLARMEQTPGRADDAPLGSGPPNRHGMPRLPPDQTETKKWPVLDLGEHPHIRLEEWRLIVDGEVERRLDLDWAALMAFPQVDDVSDFHCVTSWSRFDLRFTGVQLGAVLAEAGLKQTASHLLLYGADGYTTNLPLEEALKDDVLLAHGVDGGPLPREHGGPCRVVTPQLWAWKGAKWVNRIRVLDQDLPGFWERRGYSMTAHPWRNDRYG
jgi:DMSO/TMAO reductase YedYZ molybdopterin-dependent catalytic subunit